MNILDFQINAAKTDFFQKFENNIIWRGVKLISKAKNFAKSLQFNTAYNENEKIKPYERLYRALYLSSLYPRLSFICAMRYII